MAARQAGKEYPSCILDDFQKLSRDRPEFRPNWALKLPFTNLGAGVDTISQSLASVIAGVSLNKTVYDKLMSELEASVKDGRVSRGQPVPYEVAKDMEYLQACIREAMRMWPGVIVGLPRSCPEGGIEIDGYYIPAGSTVGLNPKQLGQTVAIFGEDVESFKPERWLQASKEQRNHMELYNLSFGGEGTHAATAADSANPESCRAEQKMPWNAIGVRGLVEGIGEPLPGVQRERAERTERCPRPRKRHLG